MKLQAIHLRRFSVFADAELELSPGVNVLIGENATGKSHLLKLLYSILRAREKTSDRSAGPTGLQVALAQKLVAVFKPDGGGLGRLVTRGIGRGSSSVFLRADSGEQRLNLSTLGNLRVDVSSLPTPERAVFLPAREMLSVYEGFVAAYENRELSFDETYYDLCVALSAGLPRGQRAAAIASLAGPLETALGGGVVLENGKFWVGLQDGNIEAHLLAEGLRKIATLVRLILNGSLTSNGFLFWDEPEANLNPKLVTRVADLILSLAGGGVQVFLATHDYLLSQELSLAAERAAGSADIRFFGLSRGAAGRVEVEAGKTIAEIEHNPILEALAAYYDRERERFVAP